MRAAYQKEKVLARGNDIYIGIDVHKEKWHVTAQVEGVEVFHGSMLSEYHSLKKLLDRFKDCKIKVAYEAGPCGFWLYDKLSDDGIEAIVVPPSLIPVESGRISNAICRSFRECAETWIITIEGRSAGGSTISDYSI